ncbi:MAG: LacI family DNA-binding transcriptional regulator [Sphingomonas sp.]
MVSESPRQPRGGPTLQDVADHAQVSVMTVSRTIKGDGKVSRATRQRVERSMAALKYSRRTVRRRFPPGEEIRIVLLYGQTRSSHLSGFLINSLLEARRHHVHLDFQAFEDRTSAEQFVDDLVDTNTDGVILLPPLCDSAEMLAALAAAEIQVVAVATGRTERETSSVTIDDLQAAREMTRHLIALGHGRIAFILGDPRHRATGRRLEGYLLALAEAGIERDDDLIAQGLFTYRSGLDAAERILSQTRPPTAIFASNDDMAAAAVAVAHQRRLDVPGDLSVCGFDDAPLATTIWPELTTVRQPMDDMSRASLELLVGEIMAGRQLAGPPKQLVLEHVIVRRQSDSAPRWSARNR